MNEIQLTSDRWPSLYSIEGFARDVIRLENAKTDEEKVFALFKWDRRVMRFGYGYAEGPTAKAMLDIWKLDTSEVWRYVVIDPVKILHVYGEGWCATRSLLFHALCWGAGFKSETVSIFDPKVRVWYRDNDGVARWHLFDPHRSWYVFTRDASRIASYEDIVADPTLLTRPSKTSVPFCFAHDENQTSMFKDDGSIFPQNPHTSFKLLPRDYHRMEWSLRKGERCQLNWSARGKFYPYYELENRKLKCRNGPHSHVWGAGTEHTTFQDGRDAVIDPDNWPWVKNYFQSCDDPACTFTPKIPVKWYGNGTLIYEPNLERLENFRDGLYSWGAFRNINVEKKSPRVCPNAPNTIAWLMFRIDSPYVIADANIEAGFQRASASDVCAIQISTDKGDTWREVWRSAQTGEDTATLNIGQQPWKNDEMSATGQYSYLVRIEMEASDPAKTGLDSLKITSDLQFNMFTLPMLQPGTNRMRFSAKCAEDTDKLRVTFCWDDRNGKGRKSVREISGLGDEFTIETNAKAPDDITMRYLLMENSGGKQIPEPLTSPN